MLAAPLLPLFRGEQLARWGEDARRHLAHENDPPTVGALTCQPPLSHAYARLAARSRPAHPAGPPPTAAQVRDRPEAARAGNGPARSPDPGQPWSWGEEAAASCFRRPFACRGATMTGQADRCRTRWVTLPNRRAVSSRRRGLPSTMRSASHSLASARMPSATRSTTAWRTPPPAARPAMRNSKTAASATSEASLLLSREYQR